MLGDLGLIHSGFVIADEVIDRLIPRPVLVGVDPDPTATSGDNNLQISEIYKLPCKHLHRASKFYKLVPLASANNNS